MAKKNILFVASEAVPFIKTGGLADVAGTLPKYFNSDEFDTRVILPYYSCVKQKDRISYKFNIEIPFMGEMKYVGVFEADVDGIPFYFIDNQYYFDTTAPYSSDGKWDMEKFTFFSLAALSILPELGFRPELIHCHDWQTGLIPVYLQNHFQNNAFYQGMHAVMTIHNLKFQGIYNKPVFQHITGLDDYFLSDDKLGFYDGGNMMKGGIIYADRVTTVSNSYAQEIRDPFYGEKLEGLMNAKANVLSGIVNGIDYDIFNPETDATLEAHFNSSNVTEEKYKNKLALQRELGLEENKDVMMVGIVSRLTDQKGFDLIAAVLDDLCQDAVQFVVLGTGEAQYEDMFRDFGNRYPGKFSANIYYSDELSHKIYGSCDAFLMPSLFEPCGLSQLMSLRYGTLPIVRETGGLKDTVEAYNEFEGTGTGFSFTNYNAHEMMNTFRYAEKVYYDNREAWDAMVKRAMEANFSWEASAKQYEALYRDILG